MVGHRLAGALALLFGFLEPEPAPSVSAPTQAELGVFVRCPALAEEASASVEARARADLLAQGIERGLLLIACTDGTARTAWMTTGREPLSRHAPLAASERERIEQLVALAAESVTSAQSEVLPAASPGAPPVTPAVATNAPVSKETDTAPPERAPPKRDASETPPRRAAIVAGPSFELWATETVGAFGARGGVALPVARRYGFLPTLAYESSLSSPGGVTVRHVFAALEFSAELDRIALLSAGVAGSFMTFDGSPEVSPEKRITVMPALVAGAALPVRFGRANLAVFCLGARIYQGDRLVTVDGRRVLRVPVATLTIGLELRAGL
jgi:hypothetical protein